MGQVPGSDGYPPPGEGYPWGMDSFLKLMISVRNPCYGAPPERDSPLEEPWMVDSLLKAHFPQGVRMPHSVLDENIVKTIGICMFSVTLFEVDSSEKHNKMKKSLSGRAHSLYKSKIPYVILVPTHPHPTGRGGGTPGGVPSW